MKLSVIVPVYKAEAYLHRCVDSLLAQETEDYEIILVNDGSPDGSQAIIKEYAARYPEMIRAILLENGGQARARNAGIEMARGDYIGFVDSDDWVKPHMFSRLLEAAETRNSDLVICDILACYADGREETVSCWHEGNPLASSGSVCNKLFRRELMGQTRFPEGLWYEDFAFSAQLLAAADSIAYVPEALYCYRIGHSSTMNNNNAEKNLDILRVMELLREAFEGLGRPREDYEYLLLNHVLLDSVNRLSLQHNPEKLAVIAQLRAYVRRQIPHLSACVSYQRESRNRRIIMRLNYMGLEDLGLLLLRWKKALKG